jgi:formylglycine-generating enzyme required for sulfatase activity
MDDERTGLEEELAHHKHNLLSLRQQKVNYAAGEEPLHLLNQIKAEEQVIQSIEQRLAELTEVPVSPPTPPPSAPIPGKKARLGGWLVRVLGDPVWQGVGAVIGLIALVVSFASIGGPGKVASLLGPTPTPTPTNTPTSTPTPTLTQGHEPEIQIPAGYFLMGSDDEHPDARPQHQVYVEALWIGKHEVSNEAYRQFVDATGHRVPYVEADWADPYNWDRVTRAYPAGKARYPAVLVSWYDAQAYCRWAGKRLPTEAEWEKAARGTDGRRYPWGDEWDHTKANTFESGRGEASPVGMYREGAASPYGVLDMAGNAWEWTASKYEPYPGNPYWTETFEKYRRVLRGGSWRETGKVEEKIHPDGPVSVSYGSVTTAFRCAAVPDDRLDDVGFRCARSAATR